MRRLLSFMGSIFLVLISIAIAVIGYTAYTEDGLDTSSRTYVDESVPAIVSAWSVDELKKRASPQLLKKTSENQIFQLFSTLSNRLGTFQNYNGSTGSSKISFTTKDGLMTTASYVSEATFQNGKAEIKIELIYNYEGWQILGFHVDLKSF